MWQERNRLFNKKAFGVEVQKVRNIINNTQRKQKGFKGIEGKVSSKKAVVTEKGQSIQFWLNKMGFKELQSYYMVYEILLL